MGQAGQTMHGNLNRPGFVISLTNYNHNILFNISNKSKRFLITTTTTRRKQQKNFGDGNAFLIYLYRGSCMNDHLIWNL